MTLARAARRPPREVAELIVKHFPSLHEVERLDVAGPGFLNVFLSPAWCTGALGEILAAGDAYGRGEGERGRRVRLEFVSANPTGPLVIVSARAAAVGDSLARLLRAQGAQVTTEYYVNDAGTQFEALARSFEARVAQEFGEPAALPENGYPGEYLIELARAYREEGRSEEHTSELQSQSNLVCRLLLEKKNKTRRRQADRSAIAEREPAFDRTLATALRPERHCPSLV